MNIFLIYELVDNSININGDIYKYYSNEKKMHIMSILEYQENGACAEWLF